MQTSIRNIGSLLTVVLPDWSLLGASSGTVCLFCLGKPHALLFSVHLCGKAVGVWTTHRRVCSALVGEIDTEMTDQPFSLARAEGPEPGV